MIKKSKDVRETPEDELFKKTLPEIEGNCKGMEKYWKCAGIIIKITLVSKKASEIKYPCRCPSPSPPLSLALFMERKVMF